MGEVVRVAVTPTVIMAAVIMAASPSAQGAAQSGGGTGGVEGRGCLVVVAMAWRALMAVVAAAVMEVAADKVCHCPLDPPAPTVVLERECSGTPPPCASSTHCGARGGAGQSWAQSQENARPGV